MSEFFSMGGRGFYVWMSFGAFAICAIAEIMLARARLARAKEIK